MLQFTKKPIIVEAIPVSTALLNARNQWEALPDWLVLAYNRGEIFFATDSVHIDTLEGKMIGNSSDWIICGVKGELYPCKPDIFKATYEAVENSSAPQQTRTLDNVELKPGLFVRATDEPSHGGANHVYQVYHVENRLFTSPEILCTIPFQTGPISENGLNGVSEEALLAIVMDRLQSFQKGDYSCRENALALTKLEEAVHWLDARTRNRAARGVEGTSTR